MMKHERNVRSYEVSEASGKAAAAMMKDENSSGYESQAPESATPDLVPKSAHQKMVALQLKIVEKICSRWFLVLMIKCWMN